MNEITYALTFTASKPGAPSINGSVPNTRLFWTGNKRTADTQTIGNAWELINFGADLVTPGFLLMRNNGIYPIKLGRPGGPVLTTPAAPTVTPTGTTGATSYSYKIVAKDAEGRTLPSTAGTTATGNATLTGVNYNAITWSAVTNATGYEVYKLVGSDYLRIANLGNVLVYNDTGSTVPQGAVPAANDTGYIAFMYIESNEPSGPIKLWSKTTYAKIDDGGNLAATPSDLDYLLMDR